MDVMERKQMPSFGNWGFYDELPVTQFFSPAKDPDPLHCHFFGKEVDLFRVPPSPLLYYYQQPIKTAHKKQQQRQTQEGGASAAPHKQRRNRRYRPQKAVEEDLYKIPPEFLSQKPKNRMVLSDFWKRCLGLNCVP